MREPDEQHEATIDPASRPYKSTLTDPDFGTRDTLEENTHNDGSKRWCE
jgi:hypothetical protein